MRKTFILSANTIILVMALFSVVTANFAVTTTLNSTADSYVNQNLGGTNYGAGTTMSVRSTTTGFPNTNHRSFVRFDVSSIPAGSTIQSATLNLYLNTAPGLSRSYDAHRVTAAWAEGTITWNFVPAVAGVATSTQATGTTPDVWLSWDVTSDVALFVAGTANNGWRIRDQVEDSAIDRQSLFRTREYAGTASDPQLVVTYTLPSYTLTYTAGAHGSISGTSPQTVVWGNDGTAVTAVPDTGYIFACWSDGSTANPRQDMTVTADITVTANFATVFLSSVIDSHVRQNAAANNYGADTTMQVRSYNFFGANNRRSFVQFDLSTIPTGASIQTATMRLYLVTEAPAVSRTYNVGRVTASWLERDPGGINWTNQPAVAGVTSTLAVTTPLNRWLEWDVTSDVADFVAGTYTNYGWRISDSAEDSGTDYRSYFDTRESGATYAPRLVVTLPSYTLTYTPGLHGTITGDSPQTVMWGNDGTAVEAVPDAHYHFVKWSDDVMTASRTDTNVTADINVTASFAIDTFTLTYNAGANGTTSGTASQSVDYGGSGTPVEAVPDTGYHFVDWSDASTANPRTDTNVTADITVTANFAINQYTLTYNAGANGTTSGTASQTVDYGTDGTAVEAVPDTGYHFVDWSDANTDNPRTDTNVTADITVTANFAINIYTVAFQTDGTAGAAIDGVTTQTIAHGDDCTSVTAIAPISHYFVKWTLEGADYATTNPLTVTNVTEDMILIARFAINTYTLTYTAGAHGSISGISPQTVDYGTDGSAVEAVPETGYHFVDWSDASIDNPRTDTNVTADISVTANFAINTYTLTYTAGEHGSISGISPQTVDYGTDGSAVEAVPDTGYHFIDWSDAITANPRTDTNVHTNINVTANFAINTYTLTYTAGEHGSISGISPQTVDYGTDGSAVEAVPYTGYHLVDWSDASTDNPRTDTNVTADISVTANFDINMYIVAFQTDGTAGAAIDGVTTQTIEYGDDCTPVTANAPTGYHFVKWTLESADYATTNPLTVTNVTEDMTLIARFAINQYTLTYTAGAHGSITGVSPQTVDYGGSGTVVTAVPDAHYHFVKWSDDVMTASRTDTNVHANINVTASFAIDTFIVTTAVVGSGTCIANPVTVDYGLTSVITITPAANHHIVSVVDSVEGAKSGSYTTTAVTINRTVTATFAINTFTVTTAVVGNGTCIANPVTVDYGLTSVITVTPAANHHIVSVVDSVEGAKSGSYTTTAVTINRTVTATFAINTFTVTAAVVGSGTCIANPVTVDYGLTSVITITPAVNHHIVSVVDSVEGAKSGSYTTTAVTSNRTVTATFAINVYTVIFQTDGTAGATLTGTTTQMVNHGADCTAVKANAPTNYRFDKWTKGGVNYSTVNPLTVNNVTEDMTLKAIFASTKPSAAKNWHLYE